MLYVDERVFQSKRDDLLREAAQERQALSVYAKSQQSFAGRLSRILRNIASAVGII